ncbi:MAG: efflux RND transporter periplasmic adaptor subunit [Deltaproteobacteria bacterium]|jgi:RND family efflux transporter MFP subunit|nr:efflux RND transporter periplasmic adaptor subunit [Deltaproteobacteria bacterium]
MSFFRFDLFRDEKKRFAALAVLAGLVIIVAILYQAGIVGGPPKTQPGEKAAAAPPPDGQWRAAEERVVPVYYVSVGTVRSREEANIISRLPAARIVSVKVRTGDRVKQGDVLVELEDNDLKSAVRSAEENLKQQESRQVFAEQKYNRTRILRNTNAVSQQELDQALSDLNAAKAATAMLESNLDSARVNVSYATIRSPFDCAVSERLVDPGNMATPESVLMKIFDPNSLEMRLPVRESLASTLKVGDVIEARIESLSKTVQAKCIEFTPSIDPGSRTFQANTLLTGDTAGILPGMFGRASIKIGEKNAVVIPKSAVRRVGQLEYLTVRNRTGTASEIMISTVPSSLEDLREVVSGLQVGDMYLAPM